MGPRSLRISALALLLASSGPACSRFPNQQSYYTPPAPDYAGYTSRITTATYKFYLYSANSGSSDVSVFALDPSDGTLSFASTTASAAGTSGIAVHPSGNFVYVSDNSGVSVYSVTPST